MADKPEHSDEGKKLLKELRDKGITDLDGLVRNLTADKDATARARKIICDNNHVCIVIPR